MRWNDLISFFYFIITCCCSCSLSFCASFVCIMHLLLRRSTASIHSPEFAFKKSVAFAVSFVVVAFFQLATFCINQGSQVKFCARKYLPYTYILTHLSQSSAIHFFERNENYTHTRSAFRSCILRILAVRCS